MIMKYAFVVFEVNLIAQLDDWEFVGVFATEEDADRACITENHMMACVTVGKATQETTTVWEFGFKYPRYEEAYGTYERGDNNYRLPEDL